MALVVAGRAAEDLVSGRPAPLGLRVTGEGRRLLAAAQEAVASLDAELSAALGGPPLDRTALLAVLALAGDRPGV